MKIQSNLETASAVNYISMDSPLCMYVEYKHLTCTCTLAKGDAQMKCRMTRHSSKVDVVCYDKFDLQRKIFLWKIINCDHLNLKTVDHPALNVSNDWYTCKKSKTIRAHVQNYNIEFILIL